MNRDFALLPSPAVARRLIRLSAVCQIEICEAIRALADLQTVDEALFDPILCQSSEPRRAATQFIIDCDFRCVIARQFAGCMDPISVLNAVRHAPHKKVVVLTTQPALWRKSAQALAVSDRTVFADRPAALLRDVESLRDHILIVDVASRIGVVGYHMANVLRLYPAALLYVDHDATAHAAQPSWWWLSWAELLFPQMPALTTSVSPWQDAQFHNVWLPQDSV